MAIHGVSANSVQPELPFWPMKRSWAKDSPDDQRRPKLDGGQGLGRENAMEWQGRSGIAVVMVLLLTRAGWSQDVPTPVPARPNPSATPAVPAPPVPPTAAPATPAAPTTPGGTTALAVPPPPSIAPTPNASGLIGSELFSQQNSAFEDLAGTRPSRTVEFLGDFVGGTRLMSFAQGVPPTPPPPPPLPNPNPPPGPPGHGGGGNGNGTLRHGAILAPAIRGFKIVEGQTPRPVDRVYYFTNYFNNVNQDINREYRSPITSILAYRHTMGFEKTFLGGQASLGVQLPINVLSVRDQISRLGGTTTSVGDLSLISKYAFYNDVKTGSVISGGLAVTIPTGPSYFAANRTVTNFHYAGITPYIGYIWARDRFFVQGFNSLSVPTSSRDVTYLYNDLGVGYYVYRSDNRKDLVTAVVPTFEVHINTPLNHRGGYLKDPAATFDVVDFTYGLNAFLRENTKLGVGFVNPVTGPRPFAFEVIANLTYRF
jgi:hypothetical protein